MEAKNPFNDDGLRANKISDKTLHKKSTSGEFEQRAYKLESVEYELKQIQEDGIKRKQFLESVLYNAPDAIVTLNSEHRVIDWNPGAVKMFGYTSEEAMGVLLDDLVARGEHHLEASEKTRQVLTGQGVESFETVRYRKDGTPLRVIASGSPIIVDDEITGVVVIYTDITERVQAEEKLQKSEEKLRNIIEHSSNLFYSHTADHKLTYVSPQCREFLQCEPEEAMIDWMNFATDNPINEIGFELTKKAIETGEKQRPYELEVVGNKGRKIICEVRESPIVEDGRTVAVVGSLLDITDRKRAAEALRESELKYKTLTEQSIAGVFIHQDDRYVYVNEKFAEMHGYESDELLGKYHFDLIHSDMKSLIQERSYKRLKGEPVPKQYEIKRLRKDGSAVWHEIMVGDPIIYDGKPSIMGHEIDISERKNAEEALRQSEERYRTVMEANPDPVVVYDVDGKVIFFNPAFSRVFGWTMRECAGKKIDQFVPKENWPETKMMIEKVISGESFFGIETRRYTKDGDNIPVSISGATFRDRDGSPVGCVINLRDISVRKKLESQLMQAQKMESIGTLAGGIAHDFNNLMMGMLGNLSLLKFDMDESHPSYEKIKNIEKNIESGTRLTSQILGYARKGKYEIRKIDMNDIVKETSETFGRTRKEIIIHKDFQEDLLPIEGDFGQIEQILWNLFINAADAMPEGGDLIIKTFNLTDEELKHKPYSPKAGDYISIEVRDTGIGMEQQTKERIFEPFFTTKEMGRGTGLGLASAYGIVKSHGGYIDVESEEGCGTTFRIYFPATKANLSGKNDKLIEIDECAGTILFVDDEEHIIDIGTQMLEKFGFKVLTAKNGTEAVRVYQEMYKEINLVILDIVMPGMSGGEVFDKLKDINNLVHVLLSSGYSNDGRAKEIMNRGCKGFIQKPFNMNQLISKINESLNVEVCSGV